MYNWKTSKSLIKKADVNTLKKEIWQLYQDIGKAESLASKAGFIVSRLDDELSDASSYQDVYTKIKEAIAGLEELGPQANSIIQRLNNLLSRLPLQSKLHILASSPKILLVDFDNTLSEFLGLPPELPGEPMPGVQEILPKLAAEGWKIHIFSGRTGFAGGLEQIQSWMDEHNLPYDSIVMGKPEYGVIIDDSAIDFHGDWNVAYDELQRHLAVKKQAAQLSKDPFEQNLYKVLSAMGFEVDLAGDGTVSMGGQILHDGKALRFTIDLLPDDPEGKQGIMVTLMLGSEDSIDADILEAANIVFKKEDTQQVMVQKFLKAMDQIEPKSPDVSPRVPETIEEVPTMDPVTLRKKRDEILDKMLQLPEGSPERKKLEDKLKALGKLAYTLHGRNILAIQMECAWCRKDLGQKEPLDNKGVSHGICEICQRKYFGSHLQKETQFYPSLVNAPTNKWQSDSDVEIPTKPEWVDTEKTWYFPYKDRNIDWDQILMMLSRDTTKKAMFRGEGDVHTWVRSDPRLSYILQMFKAPQITFDNLTIEPIPADKKHDQIEYGHFATLDVPAQKIYILDNLTNDQAIQAILLEFAKYLQYLVDNNILRSQTKTGGRQPATTWEIKEPFSPTQTQWEIHTDPELLWQQYSRQYKDQPKTSYWSNVGEVIQFVVDQYKDSQNDKESNFVFKFLHKAGDFFVGKIFKS